MEARKPKARNRERKPLETAHGALRGLKQPWEVFWFRGLQIIGGAELSGPRRDSPVCVCASRLTYGGE